MYERARRSRKQTKLKMTTIRTVYGSSQISSCSVEVVGVVVVAAARGAWLSVGNGGLVDAGQVAFCMVGGRFHPVLV